MSKGLVKSFKTFTAIFVLLFVLVSQQFFMVKAVVPSTVDYLVFLKGTKMFLHNKELLSPKIGTEYYFTYTVDSVTEKCQQNGLVLTDDATREFPYTEGGFMRYQENEVSLLDDGATYFIKITIASGGFRYDVTKAKGDKLDKIVFEKHVGDATNQPKYIGLWLAVFNMDATFKNVRCYDRFGNDLGIEVSCGSGTADIIRQDVHFDKANDIDHRYDITVEEKFDVAISNLRVPTTKNVYIQYTVESAEYALNQTGVALSNTPKDEYPHGNGYLKYIPYSQDEKTIALLEQGCEYVIKVEREKTDFTLIVQKTKNGKAEIFVISKPYGEYKEDYQYVSLWFGTGERKMNFHLTDFLIYDENRNNLGVQTNVDSVIEHSGELEDYAGCQALYYCKNKESFIALYKDQSLKYTSGKTTQNAKYKVSDNILTARFSSGTQKYDYLFKYITDQENNKFERLYTYSVSFVTGNKTEIPTQILSNETGYQVLKPVDPKLENCKFEGWYTSDDKKFDFDQIVTKSLTLYAKWSGNDGKVFTSKNMNAVTGKSPVIEVVSLCISGILLISGIAAFLLFVRKGVQYKRDKN